MGNLATKEDFLNLSLKQITQVYSGKRDCCRCGCGGTYTITSTNKYAGQNQEDVNDGLVEKRFKRAKELVLSGADFDAGGTYFDVQTGENRCLTFYVD